MKIEMNSNYTVLQRVSANDALICVRIADLISVHSLSTHIVLYYSYANGK